MAKKIKVIKRHHELETPYHWTVMAEMLSQTARGVAIAGTAYLDLLLRAVLETRMRRDNTEAIASLFENRGPLQDFSARIKTAYALQIIGHAAHDDLCIMRDIRNAFAHSADGFDFNREDIAALCLDLWYPKAVSYRGKPKPTIPQKIFIRGVQLLADGLYSVIHKRLGDDLILWGRAPVRPASPKTPKLRASRGPKSPTQKS